MKQIYFAHILKIFWKSNHKIKLVEISEFIVTIEISTSIVEVFFLTSKIEEAIVHLERYVRQEYLKNQCIKFVLVKIWIVNSKKSEICFRKKRSALMNGVWKRVFFRYLRSKNSKGIFRNQIETLKMNTEQNIWLTKLIIQFKRINNKVAFLNKIKTRPNAILENLRTSKERPGFKRHGIYKPHFQGIMLLWYYLDGTMELGGWATQPKELVKRT